MTRILVLDVDIVRRRPYQLFIALLYIVSKKGGNGALSYDVLRIKQDHPELLMWATPDSTAVTEWFGMGTGGPWKDQRVRQAVGVQAAAFHGRAGHRAILLALEVPRGGVGVAAHQHELADRLLVTQGNIFLETALRLVPWLTLRSLPCYARVIAVSQQMRQVVAARPVRAQGPHARQARHAGG